MQRSFSFSTFLNKPEFHGLVPRLDLGFIGVLSYFIVFFLSLFSPVLIVTSRSIGLFSILSHILFFVGMASVFTFAALRPGAFVTKIAKRVILFYPVIASLLFAFSVYLFNTVEDYPTALYFIFCFLMGIGVSSICLEVALFFASVYHSDRGARACFYAVVAIVIAAGIFTICGSSLLASVIVIILATVVAQLTLIPRHLLKSEQRLVKKPVFPLSSKYKHITMGFAVFGIIIGTMAAYRYVPNGLMTNSVWTVTLSVAAGGVFFGLIWVVLRERASIFITQWMLLPVPVLGLLVFPIINEEWRILINVVLLGCYMCYDIANLLAISNMADLQKVSCLRLTGLCRAFATLGTIVGWFLSAYFLSHNYNNTIMTFYAIGIIFILLFGLFIATRPKSEIQQTAKSGKWKSRCEKVSVKYDLSARESEILLLLAKSYNASAIEQKLNISNHTVRTHVNHIYKKLDIHRHQELIDLIESQD